MKSPVILRRAERPDAAAIAQMMTHLGLDHSVPEIERRWAMTSSPEQDHVILAMNGAHPCGLMTLHIAPLLFYPAPIARITTLVVEPAHRRRGIARSLISEARQIGQDLGCCRLELTTNMDRVDAQAFYHAMGFRTAGQRLCCQLVT